MLDIGAIFSTLTGQHWFQMMLDSETNVAMDFLSAYIVARKL